MKRYENKFTIISMVMTIALLIILTSCLAMLINIKSIMQAQFDYQTGMQLCLQDALEYYAPCVLEQDEDGSYNWYFNPNEGRL